MITAVFIQQLPSYKVKIMGSSVYFYKNSIVLFDCTFFNNKSGPAIVTLGV